MALKATFMTSMSLSQAPRRILPPLSLNHLKAPTTSLNPSHPFAAHTHKAAAIPTTRQWTSHKLQPRPRAQFQTQMQPPPRTFTTTPSRPAAKPEAAVLSTEQYHKISDRYIDGLVAQLEEMQEEREDVDVEYSAGVLTLILPPHGTYVLNKQPPNKQIWLSSPVSGPKRYDWVGRDAAGGGGEWVYLRDGSTLSGLLEEEVGVVAGEES